MESRIRPARAGFTLVEILVAIAIIAVLAAILFPVFARARGKARAASCMSNVRQIDMAVAAWIADHDDTFPQICPPSSDPPLDDSHGQMEDWLHGSVFTALLPYVGSRSSRNTELFVCPSDPDPHGLTSVDASGNCLGSSPPAPPRDPLTSYVYNAYYIFGATMAQVLEPPRSIFLAERRQHFCNIYYHPWFGEAEIGAGPDDPVNPVAIAAGRHEEGSMYAYADGHVKWRHFPDTRRPFPEHTLYGEHQPY